MALGICVSTLLVDPRDASDDDLRGAAAACIAAGVRDVSAAAKHWPVLAATGLQLAAVEAAVGWANAEPGPAAAEADELASLAETTAASLVVAVCLESTITDVGRARRNLSRLAGVVADAGAQVVVEFLPWTGVPDLVTAWDLVEPLGPAVGLVLDGWHWQRQPGGPAFDVLAEIPADRIGYLQLADAAPTHGADPYVEAMSARLLPGHGVVDLGHLVHEVMAKGASPFVALEVYAPAIVAEMGATSAAEAMVVAARTVFA